MNDAILDAIQQLPVDRGYRFTPVPRDPDALHINPRDPEYDGVSRSLYISSPNGRTNNDVCIARGSPDGVSYCCGVSFEAWFDALTLVGVDPSSVDFRDASDNYLHLVNDWFCPVMGHSGCVVALVKRGWGEVVNLRDAKPGDLCQFWRSVDLDKPSGHSVVFLDYDETLRRLQYWSSQRATNGIGVHEETVTDQWEIHIVRPSIPSIHSE